MTFYSEQVQEINKLLYPKDYLTKQVVRAKQHIDKHFADNVNLDKLATGAFISKFHFMRIFKSLYGTTPHQYLTSVRIENAKLLLNSQRSVSESCIAVGYNSFTSFTGLFKKITGFTPSAFKKKQFPKKQFPRGQNKDQP